MSLQWLISSGYIVVSSIHQLAKSVYIALLNGKKNKSNQLCTQFQFYGL